MPKRPHEAGPYECPECGNGLSRLSYLKEHIATVHRGEQAHRCPHPGCGKNFSQASSVKSHLRVHTGEHPFHCTYPYCGKSFTQSSNLQTHMASHSEERPHVCPHLDCGKSFKLPGSLKSHLATAAKSHTHVRLHHEGRGAGGTVLQPDLLERAAARRRRFQLHEPREGLAEPSSEGQS